MSEPRLLGAVVAAMLLADAAAAQVAATASAASESLGCAPRAAVFAGPRNFKALITRSGRMEQGNPLRPLDAVTVQVLEARLGGKVATAYGPDWASLRRGPAPDQLQAANGGAPIHWAAGVDDLPRQLRIVAEDGALIADLAFEGCGDAPKAAAAKDAARPAARRPAAKPAERTPPGINLPQGAIE